MTAAANPARILARHATSRSLLDGLASLVPYDTTDDTGLLAALLGNPALGEDVRDRLAPADDVSSLRRRLKGHLPPEEVLVHARDRRVTVRRAVSARRDLEVDHVVALGAGAADLAILEALPARWKAEVLAAWFGPDADIPDDLGDWANPAAGALTEDILDRVHPRLVAAAVCQSHGQAARTIALSPARILTVLLQALRSGWPVIPGSVSRHVSHLDRALHDPDRAAEVDPDGVAEVADRLIRRVVRRTGRLVDVTLPPLVALPALAASGRFRDLVADHPTDVGLLAHVAVAADDTAAAAAIMHLRACDGFDPPQTSQWEATPGPASCERAVLLLDGQPSSWRTWLLERIGKAAAFATDLWSVVDPADRAAVVAGACQANRLLALPDPVATLSTTTDTSYTQDPPAVTAALESLEVPAPVLSAVLSGSVPGATWADRLAVATSVL